jgi:hypothetical protein
MDLDSLEESERILEDLLQGFPPEKREQILQGLENGTPEEALEILDRLEVERSETEKTVTPSIEPSSTQEPVNFQTVLEAHQEAPSQLLTAEERAHFLQPLGSEEEGLPEDEGGFGDQDFDVKVGDQDIYEDVIISPIIKDTRRLQYLNLCVLCVLLCMLTIVCWLQYDTNRQVAQKTQSINYLRERESQGIGNTPLEFWTMPEDQQRIELETKLNSTKVTRKEKMFSYYLLATLEFQKGNFSEGRRFMLEGMKLRDEK